MQLLKPLMLGAFIIAYFCDMARKKANFKDDTLIIFGILDDVLNTALKGDPRLINTIKRKK